MTAKGKPGSNDSASRPKPRRLNKGVLLGAALLSFPAFLAGTLSFGQGLPSTNYGKYIRNKDKASEYNLYEATGQFQSQVEDLTMPEPSTSSSAKSSLRKSSPKLARPPVKKSSDPLSSVELIETIISRVMNIPQVALTKTTGSQLLAQNIKQQSNVQTQQSGQGQGIDYKLAIRPKEQGKVFAAPTPSLQISSKAPQVELAYQAPGPLAGYKGNASAPGAGASAGMSQAEADSFGDDSLQGQAANSRLETWNGSRLRLAMKNEAPSAGSAYLDLQGQGQNQYQSMDKPGVWDREQQSAHSPWSDSSNLPSSTPASPGSYSTSSSSSSGADLRARMGKQASARARLSQSSLSPSPSPSSGAYGATLYVPAGETPKRQVPELSSALNRFYKVNKQLEEVDSLAEKVQSQQSESKKKEAVKDAGRYLEAKGTRSVQILDERPVVHDAREAAQGLTSGALLGRLKESEKSDFRRSAEKKADLDGRNYTDRIAMLPPNVVTGIPLGNVSLGKSEALVVSSLGRIGKLKQQRIRNWTVYSWSKKEGNGAEALQLFFRHGQLDAIRVYDSSLVGVDFGVSPGDPLERVKERFGEPSFLLPEPGANSEKNYIYPISQVGFQLSRRSDSSPMVVSILIFSVK